MKKFSSGCVVLHAPAKLNLALDVVGVDERGYHLLEMIMQTIDLFDTVEISIQAESGIAITCNRIGIPCDQRNICYKCAKAFFEHINLSTYNLKIDIKKRIPQQAGMAGGSADGAAVLVGLNELYCANLSKKELCDIGEKIGADIPFCLIGGTAEVTGIGERVTQISDLPDCSIVVCKPNGGINTQKAFSEIDRLGIVHQLDFKKIRDAVDTHDILKVSQLLYNAFEQVCTLDDVRLIKNIMTSSGAKGALMTGSGSAVFGIYTDRKKAYDCERKLAAKYSEIFLCRPISVGPEILTKNLCKND